MTTSHSLSLKPLDIPDNGNSVILEYTAMNSTRLDMITKTFVIDFEPMSPEECPIKHTFEFDSEKAEYPSPELAMIPVAMCRDPFRQGKHKIVLCELHYADGRNKDVSFNTRKRCQEVLDNVKDHEPWYGFEQEYFITDKDNIPLDWSSFKPSIDLYCEMNIGDHIGFERQFVDLHLKACLYAGLKLYGCVKEMNPSQWEFQLGPLPGIQAVDQVILARYILVRLAETHNLKISFRNIDLMRDTTARSAFHLNLCTKNTRAEGGIKTIHEIVENISKYPQKELYKHYDLSNGEEMKWFLSGEWYMPGYDTFNFTVGEKDKSSIRIPTQVAQQGKGFIEERRPISHADPYDVCQVFTIAALFDHQGNVIH